MTIVEAYKAAICAVIDSEFPTGMKFDILESMFARLSIEISMERFNARKAQEGANNDAV